MKDDYLFVKQDEIFTPSFIQTKDSIYGNAKFVTQKDFEELDSKSKKNPTNFINLLTAYAIVAPNDTTSEKRIYAFEKGLPIKMGIDLPNALIVGPSGIGKTSIFNIPVLFDSVRKANSNVMVVTGGSNAINQACQVIQKAGGDTPIVFDLSKGFPYDPLNDLDTDRSISNFWETIVQIVASSGRDDSAWVYNQCLENLIDLTKRIKSQNLSISNLRKIIISGNYDGILKKMDGPLASFARSLKNENRNADTAQNTMRELTSWIDFHSVAFSHPSFCWHTFVANGGNVVINIPGSLNAVLRPYVTGIIGNLVMLLDAVSNSSDTGCIPHKTIINIDELGSCPLPGFTDILHLNRKQGWCVAAGIQSIAQIQSIYSGNANSVLAGFQTKLAISPDPFSAKYFSDITGRASMISPEVIKVNGQFIIGDRGTIAARNLFVDTDLTTPSPHPILGAPVLVISPPLVYQAYLSSIYQHGGFQFSNSNIDYKFKKTKQTFSIILRKGSCNPSKLDGILGFLIYTRKIDVNIAKELLSSTCKQSIVLFSTTSRKLAIQTKIMIMACAGGIESRIRIRKV